MSDVFCRLLPEQIRSVDSATFDGTTFKAFQIASVNSPITHPSRCMIVVNNTGVIVFLSWDGVVDNVALLPGASFVFDEQSNSVSNSDYNTAAKTQMYVRGQASTGLVYLSTFYAA